MIKTDMIKFREIDYERDEENIRLITGSSGFFEPKEVELALEYFNECKNHPLDADHRFLMAEWDGVTAGYTNFGPASFSGYSYYLHWIAVLNDYRNKGLGKLLLRETERIIKNLGAEKIIVETSSRPLYEPTRNFYLRNGYAVEAVIRQFYSPDDDQIILTRLLTEK